jgi:hypothetical protein
MALLTGPFPEGFFKMSDFSRPTSNDFWQTLLRNREVLMSTFQEQKRKERDTRAIHLLHTLAKLLESRPSTVADESPAAAWVDAVDKVTVELIGHLGRQDAISVIVREMGELLTRAPDARAILPHTEPGNVWIALLEWAQNTEQKMQNTEQQMIVVKSQLATLTEKHRILETNYDLLSATAAKLKVELADARPVSHHLSNTPAVSGLRVVDLGDEPCD